MISLNIYIPPSPLVSPPPSPLVSSPPSPLVPSVSPRRTFWYTLYGNGRLSLSLRRDFMTRDTGNRKLVKIVTRHRELRLLWYYLLRWVVCPSKFAFLIVLRCSPIHLRRPGIDGEYYYYYGYSLHVLRVYTWSTRNEQTKKKKNLTIKL